MSTNIRATTGNLDTVTDGGKDYISFTSGIWYSTKDNIDNPVVAIAAVEQLVTWSDYALSGLFVSDRTETNGSTTLVLMYGGGQVFRNIIDTPYTDVIYSDTGLTIELTRRGA